jgi:hypothetical protein
MPDIKVLRGPQTTRRETTCRAPEEVEALKGSMKGTGGNPSVPHDFPIGSSCA